MARSKIEFSGALFKTFATLILLVTGSSILTLPLDKHKTIPMGIPITWAGMISLPLTIYWDGHKLRVPTIKLNSFLSACLKFILLLGILWVPVSQLIINYG